MKNQNYQPILEDTAVDIKKAHSVLFAVCTAIQAEAAVDAMLPALWDTVHRLDSISSNINAALNPDVDNSGEE